MQQRKRRAGKAGSGLAGAPVRLCKRRLAEESRVRDDRPPAYSDAMMASKPPRQCQVSAAERLCSAAMQNGTAELEGETNVGKSMTLGVTVSKIHVKRVAQLPRNRTLGLSFDAGTPNFCPMKCSEYGSSRLAKYLPSNAQMNGHIVDQLCTSGCCMVTMTSTSFISMVGGRGADSNLGKEGAAAVVGRAPDPLPKLVQIIKKARVTTLVLVVDECHQLLSTGTDTQARLVAYVRHLEHANWARASGCELKVFVLLATATPELVAPEVCSCQYRRNAALLYRGVGTKDVSRDEHAETIHAQRTVAVRFTDQETRQSREAFDWVRGPKFDEVPNRREVLHVPSAVEVMNRSCDSVLLRALLREECNNRLGYEDESGFVSVVTSEAQRSAEQADNVGDPQFKGCVTHASIYAAGCAQASVADALSFIEGSFSSVELDRSPINPSSAFRVRMRMAVRSEGALTWQPVDHYHLLIVVLPSAVRRFSVAPIEELCDQKNRGSSKSTFFSMLGYSAEELRGWMNGEVASEFYKNEKMAVVIVTSDMIQGSNAFRNATAIVMVGVASREEKKQGKGRLGRTTESSVVHGEVFPVKGGYVAHHFSSEAMKWIDRTSDKVSSGKAFDNMVARSAHEKFQEMDDARVQIRRRFGAPTEKSYLKNMFVTNGNSSAPVAKPIDPRNGSPLALQFLELCEHRDRHESGDFENPFTSMLLRTACWVLKFMSNRDPEL